MNSPTNTIPADPEQGNSPNRPGSPLAIANDCCCPRLDNGNGNGRGDGCYWVDNNCPLHGIRDSYEQTDATADCCDMGKAR